MTAPLTPPTPATLADYTLTQAQAQHCADFAKAQAYVGTLYVPGTYDCGHLFLDVQRDVFGRTLHVPVTGGHAQGRARQAAQIAAVRDALAVRIDAPAHGCAVLTTSTTDNGHLLWHVGTVFEFGGEAWVLHNSLAMGSAELNPLHSFAWRGLRVEGFYQCN